MARLNDTGIVAAIARGGYDPANLLHDLPAGRALPAATTASELLVGVHRAGTPDRRSRRSTFVEGIRERVPVVAFDLPAARIHAPLSADFRSVGRPFATHDLRIAATALAHGHAVVTLNRHDFDPVPGLIVHSLAP